MPRVAVDAVDDRCTMKTRVLVENEMPPPLPPPPKAFADPLMPSIVYQIATYGDLENKQTIAYDVHLDIPQNRPMDIGDSTSSLPKSGTTHKLR